MARMRAEIAQDHQEAKSHWKELESKTGMIEEDHRVGRQLQRCQQDRIKLQKQLKEVKYGGSMPQGAMQRLLAPQGPDGQKMSRSLSKEHEQAAHAEATQAALVKRLQAELDKANSENAVLAHKVDKLSKHAGEPSHNLGEAVPKQQKTPLNDLVQAAEKATSAASAAEETVLAQQKATGMGS